MIRLSNKNVIRKSLLIVVLFSTGLLSAQENESVKKCIKEGVANFFYEIGRINELKKANLNSIHILELKDKTVLGYNTTGIYFCSNSPGRMKYIILKDQNKFKILNSSNSVDIIKDVADFLKNQNFNEEDSTLYLTECINICNENNNKQVNNITKLESWQICN